MLDPRAGRNVGVALERVTAIALLGASALLCALFATVAGFTVSVLNVALRDFGGVIDPRLPVIPPHGVDYMVGFRAAVRVDGSIGAGEGPAIFSAGVHVSRENQRPKSRRSGFERRPS